MTGVAAPLPRVAAIYALSIPLALLATPRGIPWELVAAVCAALLVPLARLGPWWIAINASFLPALSAALTLQLSPLWALGGLSLLALSYGAIWRNRVPLFFSSARAQEALARLLPNGPIVFLDVGCGDGRVLSRLAAVRPESRFDGMENALGLWLMARLRCGANRQCNVARADLWQRSFATYDIVYAFLSPAVMVRLWDKAQREMRPGALLISAFPIDGVPPDSSCDAGDLIGTQLHVWRIAQPAPAP